MSAGIARAAQEPLRFEVRFDGFASSQDNSFSLAGKGSLEVSAEGLVLRGKQRRSFRFPRSFELRVPLAEVVNVQQAGKALKFELGGERRRVQLYLDAEDRATLLAASLPETRTADFETRIVEARDFVTRLDAVSGRPWVTPVLVWSTVAVSAAMMLATGKLMGADGETYVRWGSNFGPLTTGGEWWRLVSSAFLHLGIIHLALNMLALHGNGGMTERMYGSARYAFIYFFAAVTGSLASLAWNPLVNSVGASGAVFGVLGAMLAFALKPASGIPVSVMSQYRAGTLSFLGYNLVFGFIVPGIDNAAHIGGFVGGFAAGMALARPLDAEARARGGYSGFAATVAAGALLAYAAFNALPNTGPAYQLEKRYLAELEWFQQEERGLVDQSKELQSLFAKRDTVDVQVLQREVDKLAARWGAAHDRLAATELAAGSKLAVRRGQLIEYARLRRDAYRTFGTAMRVNDKAGYDESRRLMKDADAKLQEINRSARTQARP